LSRCDRCGKPAVDAVGSRQASLFDVVPADPRATPEALSELRTGRILCLACQRTPELFAADFVAKRDPVPLRNLRPGESEDYQGWNATRTASGGFAVRIDDEPDGGPKDETTAEILDELDDDVDHTECPSFPGSCGACDRPCTGQAIDPDDEGNDPRELSQAEEGERIDAVADLDDEGA
jgi:hypothetical protein